jgi:hypothetical protein
MAEKTFFSRIFPDTNLRLISGIVEESGTSVVPGYESKGSQRWIKVAGEIFTGLDDGLYHAQYENKIDLVHDTSNKVVGYWNYTTGSGSQASNSSVVGAIAMSVILIAIAYYGGIWNFIWKGINEWWVTIGIIFFFSLYALVWTSIFCVKEYKRERNAHQMLEEKRK